jgi:hypothetical protein
MSEKVISRRGAFSLLGLAAALGFAAPATMLTSDAEAQVQPTAPAPSTPATSAPATSTPTPSASETSGTGRRQGRRASRAERRAERRTGRAKRREARRTGRTERREARQKTDKLYMKSDTTKQK